MSNYLSPKYDECPACGSKNVIRDKRIYQDSSRKACMVACADCHTFWEEDFSFVDKNVLIRMFWKI